MYLQGVADIVNNAEFLKEHSCRVVKEVDEADDPAAPAPREPAPCEPASAPADDDGDI